MKLLCPLRRSFNFHAKGPELSRLRIKDPIMKQNHEVIFSDTTNGIGLAVEEIFEHYGGVGSLLKPSKDVYIKVNGVDLKKYAYTSPDVLREVILYLQKNGANDIYVIENATQGNITRLVFMVTGMAEVCKQTGAIPVYLDETDAVPVYLEGLKSFINLSSFVYERLIEQSDQNLYISLPKLKTHSMSQITLSVKNQFGLVHHESRIADHNFNLHQKFADIYRILRPDFVIIDGLIATNHGHYIAEKNTDECIVPMNCLIGGKDPLATDVIGASFLGFDITDVTHLMLSQKAGISPVDMTNIKIINQQLFNDRKKNLTCDLLEKFPPELTIKKNVTFSNGCNNLPATIYALCKHMHVNPIKLSATNPLRALAALASAKLHGSKAIIPPLL